MKLGLTIAIIRIGLMIGGWVMVHIIATTIPYHGVTFMGGPYYGSWNNPFNYQWGITHICS